MLNSMSAKAALAVLLLSCAALAAAIPAPSRASLPVAMARAPKTDWTAVAATRVEPILAWADDACLQAADAQLVPLERFFARMRGNVPAFSEAVLGWGSKWRFVADRMPFTRGGRHDAYLATAFADHLFTQEDLTLAIEQTLAGFRDATGDIENRMLLTMRHDLADLPLASSTKFANEQAFAEAYRQALAISMRQVSTGVGADVSTALLSIVAQEVLIQAGLRLGVSAGVLGTAAGSSWATFGIGLVVGVIVDQIITRIWDWWADPEGSLSENITAKIDELERLILKGDGTNPGLRRRLHDVAKARALVRRDAVARMLSSASSTVESTP
jgi:hypothetical protein